MKGSTELPPVAVGIIIAVVAVVVVLIGMRIARGPGRVELNQEQVKKMQEMGHAGPIAGVKVQVSAPPSGTFTSK